MALARLLIHATAGGARRRGALPLWLSGVRAWAVAATRRGPAAPVGLRIADLQGQPYFSADALPAVIELPLPAGTYHVTVHQGARQRRYTVSLEQGVTVDLHLRGTNETFLASTHTP